MKAYLYRKFLVSILGLVAMVIFTACSGGAATHGSPDTVSGQLTAVNAANHSVTISSSGQPYTITGLSNQAIAALQTQIGKTYTVQVTLKGNGNYRITEGTQLRPEKEQMLQSNRSPSSGMKLDNISFVGPIQNISNSSLEMKLPDGTTLTMAINAETDQSDLKGVQLSSGQTVEVEANVNDDGSFTATEIEHASSNDDISVVEYEGKTTRAVGSDNILHFSVGTHNYSYAISPTVKLKDINESVHSITSGTRIEAEVRFAETTGNVIKISREKD